MKLVELAIRNTRLTLSVLVFLIFAGAIAYVNVPKEAEPDIQIPIMYVQMTYNGISPEDSERLLLRPMETQVKTIAGIKKMTSTAYENGGSVLIEFQAGTNLAKALQDVRAAVSDAKANLPQGMTQDPTVHEVNISEFPVLVVTLSGDVPERALTAAARDLRDKIADVHGVLDASLQGVRDDVVDVTIDPSKLISYGLRPDQLISGAVANNQLVAAGAMEGNQGRYAIKVPALIETPQDVANLPLVATGNAVVRAKDVATITATQKDPTTITRLNGKPAIAIAVSKRSGANLIETVDAVKKLTAGYEKLLPKGTVVSFSQDKSTNIRQLLSDLQNSVLTAVILVFIVILFSLSARASLLIGLAIPSSFLMGILGLSLAGLTVNIVVLFSLILAVGMLVDDAIIVTEFAERRMAEGMEKKEAFAMASHRMSGPVIAATMTRVAAFSPLLFWPGIVGQFMMYLPLTLIATLSASMLYALIFAPTLGALIAKKSPEGETKRDSLYMRFVARAIRHPWLVVIASVVCLVAVPVAYGKYGAGVQFFPNVEPDYGLLYVHARGNLSIHEMDALTRQAEVKLLHWPGIKTVYTCSGQARNCSPSANVAADVVGVIQYEFVDWRHRPPASDILASLRNAMVGLPGVDVEVSVPRAGPPNGKPIQVELSQVNPTGLDAAARRVAAALKKNIPDAVDISNGLPPPGVTWELKVDRAGAAKAGVAPGTIGAMVQLVTDGLKLTDYRPPGEDKAVDIRLRLPPEYRTLSELDELRVPTSNGPVPLSNFVKRVAAPSTGTLTRINGVRTVTVSANVREGAQTSEVQAHVTKMVAGMGLEKEGIRWRLGGSNQDQKDAAAFLSKAAAAAVFLIFGVLLAQFNKFTSVGLVLSAVVMSTIGVFLGLIIMQEPFGVVMTGIGIIALAGVVVNNNIVLIDTFDKLRAEGMGKVDAILETCHERARPVVLTAITAILGVLPIAFGLNLEILGHETTYNAPSTQWWISLSSAIVFGLAFATILTLIVTPSLLMLVTRDGKLKWRWFGWFRRRRGDEVAAE